MLAPPATTRSPGCPRTEEEWPTCAGLVEHAKGSHGRADLRNHSIHTTHHLGSLGAARPIEHLPYLPGDLEVLPGFYHQDPSRAGGRAD